MARTERWARPAVGTFGHSTAEHAFIPRHVQVLPAGPREAPGRVSVPGTPDGCVHLSTQAPACKHPTLNASKTTSLSANLPPHAASLFPRVTSGGVV